MNSDRADYHKDQWLNRRVGAVFISSDDQFIKQNNTIDVVGWNMGEIFSTAE